MRVIPIPLFEDNYSYLVHGANKKNSMLVDPADSAAILQYLKNNKEFIVTNILLTHKHWDHAGGVPELVKSIPELYKDEGIVDYKLEVYGGSEDNIPNTTVSVKEKTTYSIEEIKITALPTPCHTRGAISFYLEDTENSGKTNDKTLTNTDECYRCVFTGDTLFIGGSGRFFEGTAKEMLANFDLLSSLPLDTYVYCGHEYTVSNLEFSVGIEWENTAYEKKLEWAKTKRSSGAYTIPSTIGEEQDHNIFMRCRIPELMKKLEKDNPEDVMATLREYKNNKTTLKK
jgi:hydroxyacylglutathione hydrolase